MRRMHWTWDQLQATPMYVRRYCWDFLNAVAEQEQAQNDRAHSEMRRAQGVG